MSDLPESWTSLTFGQINRFESKTVEPASRPDEVFELYSVPSYPSNRPELLAGSQIGSTKQTVEPNDVLVCKINPRINRVWIVGPKREHVQIASSEWIGFRSDLVRPAFAKHYFSSPAFRDLLCSEIAGVGGSLTRAQPKRVAGYPIPLAPPNEQTRIADQLDTLLARIQACNDRLDAMPALLKRFRKGVLDEAMTGAMTDSWRSSEQQRLNANDVVATRLRHETGAAQRRVEEFLLNHPPQSSDPSLPAGWLRTHVGAVGTVSNGSTPSRSVSDYWGGDIPWVSSGEVANRPISSTREMITAAGFENSSVRLLPAGTVLIAMIGEGKTRGQSALLTISACINQNVAGVVPIPELISSRYLWYWFQRQYETTRTQGNGSGPKALNCERVRELEVLLPPLVEQAEIVRRVEVLFALADRIEARRVSAVAHLQRLTPLTLAKAFRGELVPQDPSDEPASALLARIAAQRAAPASATQFRQPRRGRPPRAPKEAATMTKSRQDQDVMNQPYLAHHLRRIGTPATAEALFKVAELPVADFYKQLAWEVAHGHVHDNQTTLEPAHAAG